MYPVKSSQVSYSTKENAITHLYASCFVLRRYSLLGFLRFVFEIRICVSVVVENEFFKNLDFCQHSVLRKSFGYERLR